MRVLGSSVLRHPVVDWRLALPCAGVAAAAVGIGRPLEDFRLYWSATRSDLRGGVEQLERIPVRSDTKSGGHRNSHPLYGKASGLSYSPWYRCPPLLLSVLAPVTALPLRTLDCKLRKAEFSIDRGLATVLPKHQGNQNLLGDPQEVTGAAVKNFVRTKRQELVGRALGGAGVAGMFFALKSRTTEAGDAVDRGNLRFGDHHRVSGVFNGFRVVLYTTVVGIRSATAAGNTHNQFIGIKAADRCSATTRVPQSEFPGFRQALVAALDGKGTLRVSGWIRRKGRRT